MNWKQTASLVAASLVLLGNLVGAFMGYETWSAAAPQILLALGVFGIHPKFQ